MSTSVCFQNVALSQRKQVFEIAGQDSRISIPKRQAKEKRKAPACLRFFAALRTKPCIFTVAVV